MPQIAAQPFGGEVQNYLPGQLIQSMTRIGRRVWLSYGDLNANSGPIAALFMDLDDPGTFVDKSDLTTEGVTHYRSRLGKIYVAFNDPREGIGNPESGSYAVSSDNGETWTTVATANGNAETNTNGDYTQHVGDALETADGIWLCGLSQVGDPGECYWAVWRSVDGGVTWTMSLKIDAGANNAVLTWIDKFMQFGDDLIVQVPAGATDIGPTGFYKWSAGGTEWVHVTPDQLVAPTVYSVPFEIGGVLAHIQFDNSRGTASPFSRHGLITDDLTFAQNTAADALHATLGGDLLWADVSDDGERLYVLNQESVLYRVLGDGTVTALMTIPSPSGGVTCFTVDEDNGLLYYGDMASTVRQIALPA